MASLPCAPREVWFEDPRRVAAAVKRALEPGGCSFSETGTGRGVRLEARCGGCRLVVAAETLGPVPESLGTLSRLAGEAGLGRVLVDFQVEGDCSRVCALVEAALFRGGG